LQRKILETAKEEMDFELQHKFVNIAIEAAYLAGQKIIEIYTQSDLKIEYKTDSSPLTLADKAANTIIENVLKQTQIPVISEENIIPDYEIRKNWKYCWIVDPLDRTKEFIKRNGQFSVNIALIESGNPILGVVYAPDLGSIYFSYNNQAFMLDNVELNRSFDEFWKVLTVNKKQLPLERKREKYIILASLSHQNPETTNYIEELKSKHQNIEINNIGSSLKFCMIAAGKADIYPRFSNINEWDSAAGNAIVIAAGGTVVDVKYGLPLKYNKESLINPWFIASI
jgi:3'(2'), 5'-bisphosphate nucleotidase